jgi:hypothetical protein
MALLNADGTWRRNLPLTKGISWMDELSAPGALSCMLPLDDAATLEATDGRILKVFWRGRARQAAMIDLTATVDVAVDGRMWRAFSNLPGMMAALSRIRVYPEFGVERTAAGTRTLGYMSKRGPWFFSSGNWVYAQGVRYNDDAGFRAGKPEGLSYPNPMWIGKNSPYHVEAAGKVEYFRKGFTTSVEMTVQILATADNILSLWLDGEQLISPDQQAHSWTELVQVKMTLQPGVHVFAAKVVNGNRTTPSPMALIFTMQQLQDNDDVVLGTPLLSSDTSTLVSDDDAGYRRGEAISLFWREASNRGHPLCDLITLGFTDGVDTDGVTFTDQPGEYVIDLGSSELDVIQTMCEKEIDAWLDPQTLKLCVYVRKGSDKTGTVVFDVGRDGGWLVSHKVDRVAPKCNVAAVQLADETWIEVEDSASVAEFGRIEGSLSLGSTSDRAIAAEIAAGLFTEQAWPTKTYTSELSSLAGPQLYQDFDLGDTVAVPNEDATDHDPVRLLSVTCVVDDASGKVGITPEWVVDRSA